MHVKGKRSKSESSFGSFFKQKDDTKIAFLVQVPSQRNFNGDSENPENDDSEESGVPNWRLQEWTKQVITLSHNSGLIFVDMHKQLVATQHLAT